MKTQPNSKMYMIFAIFVLLLSCNGFAQYDKTPSLSKTFQQDGPGNLYARSSGGSVSILTHDQQKVIINLFIHKNGRLLPPSDPAIDDVLELYDFNIEKNGSDITAVIKRKIDFNSWRNAGISLQIIVPEEMSCDASSSGGGLKASGVKGKHQFSSSGGSVHLENITGTTKASSSGGKVDVKNQNGDATLSSSGGSVSLVDGKGNVNAHSSGGGVHLINIHGDVDASSSGGGVKVSGETGYLKATSSGGSVRVNVEKLSKELYLRSSGGGIDANIKDGDKLGLDLDLSAGKVNIDLENFSGRAEKDRIKGTTNNGGIPVYMHASGGNVNVQFWE